jgi:predicted MFS family arabinose efflux permease
MKVLLTIFAVVLMAPVLLVVGIALGPAALVILFIVGIALIMAVPVWLVERARSHHARRVRVQALNK